MMQDCCKQAIIQKVDVVNEAIAHRIVNELANDYLRIFDFVTYEDAVREVMESRATKALNKQDKTYLLRNLFVLEYRQEDKIRYAVHPCLRKVMP